LGWNPGDEQELFSIEQLVEKFDLSRVQKAGAKFDPEKTKWFNQQHLREMPTSQLADNFSSFLEEKNIQKEKIYIVKVIDLVRERAVFENDLWNLSHFFFVAPKEYLPKAVKKNWKEQTPELIKKCYSFLESVDDYSSKKLEEKLIEWIKEQEIGLGKILNPIRLLLVGETSGPHLFDIIELLGKKETLIRISTGIDRLA
ncbi:MAG: glutamate--tRNA ligase, partial [Bacteroidota bacterium]|nr:glutamate--tRNA ligase [Bacteroidota bacterium]